MPVPTYTTPSTIAADDSIAARASYVHSRVSGPERATVGDARQRRRLRNCGQEGASVCVPAGASASESTETQKPERQRHSDRP